MKNLLKAGIPAMMLVFVFMAAGCEGPPEMNEPGDAPYGITVSGYSGSKRLILTITGETVTWRDQPSSTAIKFTVNALFAVTYGGNITDYDDVTCTGSVTTSSKRSLDITFAKKGSKTGTITFTPRSVANNQDLYGINYASRLIKLESLV
jgi:hypothetical protein